MPTTQEQRRRGTAAQVAAFTPAVGELIAQTDDKRLHLGDGLTAGGHEIPNARDGQNQRNRYAAGGGTGNAVTITLTPAPTAYTAGMKVKWKQPAGNTAAVTLNVNALGAKDLRKDGTTVLASGDLVLDRVYEATYDGTLFQLNNAVGSAAGEVFIASEAVSVAQASIVLAVTAGYDFYALKAWLKPVTDGAVPRLEFSVDGGASYLAGNTCSVHELSTATIQAPASPKLLGDTANSSRVGNDAGDGVGFELALPALAGTQRKRFSGTIAYTDSDATGASRGGPIFGENPTQSAVTHIKLSMSSGNLTGWAGLTATRRT